MRMGCVVSILELQAQLLNLNVKNNFWKNMILIIHVFAEGDESSQSKNIFSSDMYPSENQKIRKDGMQ